MELRGNYEVISSDKNKILPNRYYLNINTYVHQIYTIFWKQYKNVNFLFWLKYNWHCIQYDTLYSIISFFTYVKWWFSICISQNDHHNKSLINIHQYSYVFSLWWKLKSSFCVLNHKYLLILTVFTHFAMGEIRQHFFPNIELQTCSKLSKIFSNPFHFIFCLCDLTYCL